MNGSIRNDPSSSAATFNAQGNTARAAQRLDAALEEYSRAVELAPDNVEFLFNRANVLRDLKRHDDALTTYDRLIALRADSPEVFNNRGTVLAALGRHEDAIADYDRSIALRPANPIALNNLGNVLCDLRRYEEAVAAFDQAASLIQNAEIYFNRGNALGHLGCTDDALASYAQALSLQPDHAEVHWNEALVRLRMGDFANGWRKYEWRWKKEDQQRFVRHFPQPQWTGTENVRGKTILLHAEQGLGDTIQFARYARMVAERGARVLLEVPRTLLALFQSLEGVHALIEKGTPLPAFDLHCPLMSLPGCFDTRLETIPSFGAYLSVAPEQVAAWRERLGAKKQRRVGIAWFGSAGYKENATRSIPLATLLRAIPDDFEIFNLQREIRAEDRTIFDADPRTRDVLQPHHDLSDAAALIASMDVVVSVDTVFVHLAGALGLPVWVLLAHVADWRWLTGRTDSPWYPGTRLFRQPRVGDWESVAVAVKAALGTDK